jgi:hypothetical protein
MTRQAVRLAVGLVFAGVAGWAGADPLYIAGTAPDARPEFAPTQTEYVKGAAWYCRAMTGIERPYPTSLRFLEDQEGWYSPFIVAGMTGRYDIRNWHAAGACRRR